MTIDSQENSVRFERLNRRTFVLLGLILLAAIGFRLIYGYGLPTNGDEDSHLEFAKTISLHPDHLNLPMGNRETNHPILCVYITAFAHWMGNGSIYFIRCVFILISAFGLIGMFLLARALFGNRAGFIALVLVSLDHHLISYAPLFLEPVYLCLVPWVILSVYKAVDHDKKYHWLLLGLYFGIGYQCSEIFMLLAPSVVLYIFYRGKFFQILKTREVYFAGLIFILFVLPHIFWNINNQAVNITRHTERVRNLGLVPRAFLLYIGGILICLKDSSWFMMGLSNKTYQPYNITCHWITGLVYLASLFYTLRYYKDRRMIVLHFVVWSIFLPVSILNANEPWNEFGWASMTVFPVIALTASLIDRGFHLKWYRFVSIGLIFLFTIYTGIFLSGLKYGYASPSWEKRFFGKALYYYFQGFYKLGEQEEARKLVGNAVKRHPDNVIALFYKGIFIDTKEEREKTFKRILELDTYNPLVNKIIAFDLIQRGKNKESVELLKRVIENGNDFVVFYQLLGRAEFNLGNYSEAEKHILSGLKIKPDEFELYNALFLIYAGSGKMEKALEAVDRYAMSTGKPSEYYLYMSDRYRAQGNKGAAAIFYERARKMDPDLPISSP